MNGAGGAALANTVAEPVARARSALELADWFGNAEPGAKCVYFSGPFLVETESVAAARVMVEAGDALFVQIRRPTGSPPLGFDYCVIKRANREARAKPPRVGNVRIVHESRMADEDAELLLSILRRLASTGRACPTNSQLADLAMLKDGESVRYRLGLLQAAGKIEVATPPQGPRVVTICASGRKTARA